MDNKARKGLSGDNRGFSLTELLVVIAILSLAVGFAGSSISLLYSRDAQRCAQSIDEALEQARSSGMTKKGYYQMQLDLNKHTVSILFGATKTEGKTAITTVKLPKRVALTVTAEGVALDSAADIVTVEFDKATGKVKQIMAGAAPVGAATLVFQCESGSRQTAVTLVSATGRHLLTYE